MAVFNLQTVQLIIVVSYFFFQTILGLKLFGESYSGLEYDYKGLCNVYTKLSEAEKLLEYTQVLETWRIIREENNDVSNN